MEATVLGIAKSALSAVVKAAATAITDEVGLLLGVQEELFFIKEELEMMQAFLRAASIGDLKGEVVITWVKQVRELAYDVEDCLQEASVYPMEKGCLPAMFTNRARDRIAPKIKVLKVRIEDVSKRNQRYGLIRNSRKTATPGLMDNNPMTHVAFNEEALLVGLSKPKQELLRLITENNKPLEVISVVGMDGIGKTTLVKYVYGCPELRSEFERFAWVNLLHPFNEKVFADSLDRQLSQGDHKEDKKKGTKRQFSQVNHFEKLTSTKERMFKMEDEEHNQTIMTEQLKEKCLVVVDDLTDEIEWRKIKSVFSKYTKDKECLIITTTRYESLAESISGSSRNIYKVPALSKKDSLDLFYKAVFKDIKSNDKNNSTLNKSTTLSISSRQPKQTENTPYRSFGVHSDQQELASINVSSTSLVITKEMQKQAYNIIERCDLLPLAIIVIGSYLATRPKSSAEWKAICDHLTSEIYTNRQLEPISTLLSTSCDNLPYNLKSCFLYLCVFHKHQEIRRSRIVRRWMAEGFILERSDMTAQEVGNRYFNDLMGRSLIQPSEVTTVGFDTVTRCKIHDLIYDMVVAKTENENVVSLVGDRSCISTNSRPRHVVIVDWKEKSIIANMNLSHVRSVTVFGKVGRSIPYHKMRLLRVLDLEGTMDLKDCDIKRIGKLRHLKYLGLRRTTITKLPHSLEKLHDLETIDIRNTWVHELPRGIVKLQKLSYLRAGCNFYDDDTINDPDEIVVLIMCLAILLEMSKTADFLLSSCCVEAPSYDQMLSSLFGVKVPRRIGKLRSLRNLGTVHIGQSNSFIMELRCLSNLTKLAVTGFSKKNGKGLAEAIGELSHLRSLVLSALDEEGLSCCLASVPYPPKYLQSLKLFSSVNELPTWISSLDSLAKIHLRDTKLMNFGVIEKLPNLKILFILENSCDFPELRFVPNTFPMLQRIFLDSGKPFAGATDDEQQSKVSIEETALERLVHLKIRKYWAEVSGLHSMQKLKEVVLVDVKSDFVKSVDDMIKRNKNEPSLKQLSTNNKAS